MTHYNNVTITVEQWHSDYCHDHPVLGQWSFTDTFTSSGTVAQLLVTIIQYWDRGILLSRSLSTGTVAQGIQSRSVTLS